MSLPKDSQTVNLSGSESIHVPVPPAAPTVVNLDEETGIGNPFRKIYIIMIQCTKGAVQVESFFGAGSPTYKQVFKEGEELMWYTFPTSNPLVPTATSYVELTNVDEATPPETSLITFAWVGKSAP